MFKKIIGLVTILVLFVGLFSLSTLSRAQELSSQKFIDDFTFDKEEVQVGQNLKLSFEFSEKEEYDLKSGDTLTLTLPPELRGFHTDFPLKDANGTSFGMVHVVDDQIQIVFNDTVEKLLNIRGKFVVTAQAQGVESGESKEVTTNFGKETIPSKTVTIHNPEGGGETPDIFFYKTGDILPEDPSTIRWFLNFNINEQELPDQPIRLTDKFGQGMVMKDKVLELRFSNGQTFTAEEFNDSGYGSIKLEKTGLDIEISGGFLSKKNLIVYYEAEITEFGHMLESFDNYYKLDYNDLSGVVEDSSGATVTNISYGGEIIGELPKKSELKIIKYVVGQPDERIKNVTFSLYTANNTLLADDLVTNETGEVLVTDLPEGTYYIKETAAPANVIFDSEQEYWFSIQSGNEKGILLAVGNERDDTPTVFRGEKVWVDDNNANQKRPESIIVNLLRNGMKIAKQEVISSEEGQWLYAFEDLEKYDGEGNLYQYTVSEEPVPHYESSIQDSTIINTYIKEETGSKEDEHFDPEGITAEHETPVQSGKKEKLMKPIDKTAEKQKKLPNTGEKVTSLTALFWLLYVLGSYMCCYRFVKINEIPFK
ncbi:Cna B-type domain-containing protein [Enterococcus quebecensis]|uniref:Collagen-binding protein n=1 Tax=Enterococcus quebecensis TaxID=903983 RepID=A0A1E5GS99_9ENTE|nr:Cna B-type domain-containing protein [Enterococcus quebecensis]OEG15594.1 hypothetical protein BCR23_09005 [Enterococcus quebecensis]OJG74622.1 hypothetical protein RV12_GL002377 [Enterococcus quebecensis]